MSDPLSPSPFRLDGQAETLVTFERLLELVRTALTRSGMSAGNAEAVAGTVAACERDGAKSHGLLRLPGFIEAVRCGWADGLAAPAVEREGPALLKVDARNGFAQTALRAVRDRLTGKAVTAGAAVLLVRDAHHFGALWPDIEGFAAEGLVALTCVNSRPRMAVWGGREPVVGTNAMAFACPRIGSPPFVWDQSSSVMAQGELLVAAQEGRSVPPDAGFDRNGHPSTSPEAILDGGALAPFGKGKGASVAVMVEILAAALTGAAFGIEEPEPPSALSPSKSGQFLLLVDPRTAASNVAARVDVLCSAILGSGASRLPGERRHEARRRAEARGIPVAAAAYVSLLEAAGVAR